MNRQRYLELERNEACLLTEEELSKGWHWCQEWDFMLVGPGMQELRCCDCPCAAEAKKEVVKEAWSQKLERRLKLNSKKELEETSLAFKHDMLEASFNNEPQW